MLRLPDHVSIRERWGRVLPFLATDLVKPFLDDIECPFTAEMLEFVRTQTRGLADPLDRNGLEHIVRAVQHRLDQDEFERFICWATFVYDPVNSPYLIWSTYELDFELWSAAMRRGLDPMTLGAAADPIWRAYKERMDRREPSVKRREITKRLGLAEKDAVSSWDRLLMDLKGPREPGDLPWDPYFTVQLTFDMAQFQRFMYGMLDASDNIRQAIESHVEKHFHRANPGPFLRIHELPFCHLNPPGCGCNGRLIR